MSIKLGKSITTRDRNTGKLTTEHSYIKIIAIKELIEKFNNANTRKRDKQKIKNELVRRGGVVFEEIR
jgi:SOS response regulatory protein OraA/RecX